MGGAREQRKTTCSVIMSAGMQEVIMQNWSSLIRSCTLQLKAEFSVSEKYHSSLLRVSRDYLLFFIIYLAVYSAHLA